MKPKAMPPVLAPQIEGHSREEEGGVSWLFHPQRYTVMMPLAFTLFVLSGPPPEGGGGGLASLLLPFLLVFVVFYFFIIRPQKKREDTRKTMIDAVKKGDRIVTIGGVHATVTKVDDASVLAQVDDNVKLRFDKNAISSVATKE